MSGLSKYEKMKKNLKKNNIITDGDRKQRDRIMKEDSEKLKGEIIQAERYNIKEIIEDSKQDKEIVNKRISEEREITEILKDYKNISNISFGLRLDRLPIISNNICFSLNEN